MHGNNLHMPTLLIKNGFRFFFYISEPKFKTPHIHVERRSSGCIAVFWLEPYVSLQRSRGFNRKEIAIAQMIVLEHKIEFKRKYYELIKPQHKQ